MDIDDLRLLGDSLLRYRQERYSFAQRKDMLGQAGGFGAKAWADYADMGWCSSAVAADEGGFDNDAAVVVALMRHVGECLAMEPLLGSAIVCGAMLSACGAAGQSHLQALAQGKQIFSLAHLESQHSDANASMTTHAHEGRLSGSKVLVLHGDAADALIVTARSPDSAQLSLHWVDPRAPGVKCTPYPLVDQRHAASFEFDGVLAQPLAQGQAAQDALALGLRMETLGLCAEAHGAMSALNRFTLAHLKERRQFGRPIGANQALQHRMVDLFMLEQETSAAIAAAVRACHDEPAQAQRAIHAAAAHAMAAARQASHEAVQMHGGMGMTEELPASHYFRRIMVINRLLGNRDDHLMAFMKTHQPGDTQT